MKITKLETIALAYPTKKPFFNAIGKSTQRCCLIVRIQTDEGIVGIGEAAFYGGPMVSTITVLEKEIAPKLIGLDPMNTEYIWSKLYFDAFQHSRSGIFICALSGVDIALWDIKAKALKLPLYKLLGGYERKIKVYASGGFYGPGKGKDELAAELKSYVDLGFDTVKMKVGRTYTPMNPCRLSDNPDECTLRFEDDIERVVAVRDAIGKNISLAVDANTAWTLPYALKAGRIFDQLNVFMFEEPINTDDNEGSAELVKRLDLTVAGYETEYLLCNFSKLIEGRCIGLAQPDLSWAGGITECNKIAAVAQAHNMEVAPHAFSSGILLAASLHFSGGHRNGANVEFDMTDNALREDLLTQPFKAENGYVTLDDNKYGLGIELREDTIARYRVDI